ncbi:MAG: GH32 C-terminal domain-containing protein, partial [Solobacterium sp.]|nr:GH32 C-terminal domain-containing protein [Solobacterium sp.]
AADEEHHTTILYDRIQQEITVDRSRSGTRTAVEHIRTFRTKEYDDSLKLRLILDRFSIELFVNDGEQTFTMVIDTDFSADRIRFLAEGEAVLDMEAYTLDLQEQ